MSPAPAAPPAGPRPLHPRQRLVWTVQWAIATAVLVAMAAATDAVLAAAEGPRPLPPGVAAVMVAVAGGLLAWQWPRLSYERWRYEIAPTTLELGHGVITHQRSSIPYFRVQHIDISQGPVERALGLSRLVVRTASASTDAEIPGIGAGEAAALRDVILARTGRGDAV